MKARIMMKKTIIEVQGLKKKFKEQEALAGIDFSIQEGEIFGFLGPSGSGKTTTINILTGQLKADAGTARILASSVDNLTVEVLEQIGIVSDTSGFYEKMSLYNNLKAYAMIFGVDMKKVDELLQKVGLYDSRNKVAEKLSTGMKQRMLLVRALINQPKLLFLDEPTSGLDPSTSRTIHDLLLELKAQGTTIFLTTHDMQEATLLCDRLALLHKGELVEVGSPHEIIQKYNTDKKVRLEYVDLTTKTVAFEELQGGMDLSNVISIHSCEPTLEDVFITLTGGTLNV
jgi:ABC transporter, ATP-binding protein